MPNSPERITYISGVVDWARESDNDLVGQVHAAAAQLYITG